MPLWHLFFFNIVKLTPFLDFLLGGMQVDGFEETIKTLKSCLPSTTKPQRLIHLVIDF